MINKIRDDEQSCRNLFAAVIDSAFSDLLPDAKYKQLRHDVAELNRKLNNGTIARTDTEKRKVSKMMRLIRESDQASNFFSTTGASSLPWICEHINWPMSKFIAVAQEIKSGKRKYRSVFTPPRTDKNMENEAMFYDDDENTVEVCYLIVPISRTNRPRINFPGLTA